MLLYDFFYFDRKTGKQDKSFNHHVPWSRRMFPAPHQIAGYNCVNGEHDSGYINHEGTEVAPLWAPKN